MHQRLERAAQPVLRKAQAFATGTRILNRQTRRARLSNATGRGERSQGMQTQEPDLDSEGVSNFKKSVEDPRRERAM